jgi:hypothetical protein
MGEDAKNGEPKIDDLGGDQPIKPEPKGNDEGGMFASMYDAVKEYFTLEFWEDQLVNNLNVRIKDFSNPHIMGICIAFFMFCGLLSLLLVNNLVCPKVTTVTATNQYITGSVDMQREAVAKILNPGNEDELEEAGITRSATICLVRAGLYRYQDGTNGIITFDYCLLPDDKGLADDGWDVTWCPGQYEIAKKNWADFNTEDWCDLSSDSDFVNPFIVESKITTSEVQESCPNASAAIGAALAYIAYIEIFVTAVVGYILVKAGICKPDPKKERANIFQLVSACTNDGQEMEDNVDDLRTDVDYLLEHLRLESKGKKALLLKEQAANESEGVANFKTRATVIPTTNNPMVSSA